MLAKRLRIGAGTIVAVSAVVLAASVFGVSGWRAEANLAEGTPPPMPVAAHRVSYEDNALIQERFPGVVSARRQSALGFQQGGLIEDVLVDVGDVVTAGQALARLDTRTHQAQIAAADAQTREAAAQTALARDTQERQRVLLERGHISQQRFDEVVTSADAAQARQNAAAASADAMRVQLDLTMIEAPYEGVITARLSDEGAIASPGAPILEIVETGAREVRIGLPASIIGSLVDGQHYSFEGESGDFSAVFRSNTGLMDRQTRTVAAVFDIPADQSVIIGEIARLVVETPVGTSGFWVPTDALSESRRGLWSVFILQPEQNDYRLEARVVEAIRVEADRVFVRGAVADGEYILAAGLQRVTTGQLVALQAGEEAE
ncbi:MAG: efflux RND transporter periplasmic adaptor subunit [Maricaulis sp.]|uniref:efflux RND transporter periplasmic adaptor subunit n=1 Tax=Maricaulis sp. TaxID=1486257 RepID=UPI001B109C89|nr:efflux RND transporter periplasmic adaptor subunit [Maricaulis sp.]MBO6728491.1 efflux RND transporter periplasmic adaptor subunit [Maricaulis sp.]MBO6848464.1 efflux RND transporter periplasmic adaptor subunit [Maricaulis sp.]MBO6877265.1 efflux RND transporter periplasmic adaptor subunit [Maricaulis sp.]